MNRIKSIEFFDDIIFNSAKFDFTINGKTMNTIILAGKNGSGKTKLLEFIYKTLNSGLYIGDTIGKVHAIMIIDISEHNYTYNDEIIDELRIKCINQNNDIHYYTDFYQKGIKCNPSSIKFNDERLIIPIYLKAQYSPVDITYKPINEVKNVSNKVLDNDDISVPRDLASEIIQLLVDIKNQDNNDLAKYVYENPKKLVPNSIKDIRMNRFNKAFFHIFNKNLKFKELEDNIIPIFQKGNSRIKIDDLSSGEKQIVFRGTYLLRNKESLNGVVTLIDEPEISMHPTWNNKIYTFYRRIFKTDKGKETSQMIMATHSEYVIEEALKDENCIIVKMDTNNKYILYNHNLSSTGIVTTSAMIKYHVFDILSIDYHIQLFSTIQNNYVGQNSTIKDVDDYLIQNNSPIKNYSYFDRNNKKKTYNSLCVYIRNCIDHPDVIHNYTKNELKTSIDYMEKLIENNYN